MGHVQFVPGAKASPEPAHFPNRVEAVAIKQRQEDRGLKIPSRII